MSVLKIESGNRFAGHRWRKNMIETVKTLPDMKVKTHKVDGL